MTIKLEFPDDVRPDFQGFSPLALEFLDNLKKNNERSWFKTKKTLYDLDVKFPMECLLAEFNTERRPVGFPVRGDPTKGIFRIYRDVRFSKNKAPYKTHVGAVMTRSGGKDDPGLIYVHIEPGQSFLSAGFYSPDRNFLTALRLRIAKEPNTFIDMLRPFSKPRGKYFVRNRGALKTMPRGFQDYTDSPVAEYLKSKHFLVGCKITDKQAQNPSLIKIISEFGYACSEMLAFGWDVYETAYDDDPRKHMRLKSD